MSKAYDFSSVVTRPVNWRLVPGMVRLPYSAAVHVDETDDGDGTARIDIRRQYMDAAAMRVASALFAKMAEVLEAQ